MVPDPTPANDFEAVVTTDLGVFRFSFDADKAPKHVEQFLSLARQGYFDGSAFFHVVANGMIQGGDPLLKDPKTDRKLWGSGGLNLIPSEVSSLKHERGAISAARIPGKPDSDGAQFFVVLYPQPSLDGQYSVFGHMTEGIEVAQKISQVPVAADGMTETPVRILKVTIENKKTEPFLNATTDELRRTVTLKTRSGPSKSKWSPTGRRTTCAISSSSSRQGGMMAPHSTGW
ncbi:MAG: peptidylprolyl isomerase [Ignavibacteriota bacterium]